MTLPKLDDIGTGGFHLVHSSRSFHSCHGHKEVTDSVSELRKLRIFLNRSLRFKPLLWLTFSLFTTNQFKTSTRWELLWATRETGDGKPWSGFVPFPRQGSSLQTLPCQVTQCEEVLSLRKYGNSPLSSLLGLSPQAHLCSLLVFRSQRNKTISPFTLCLQQTQTRDETNYRWLLENGRCSHGMVICWNVSAWLFHISLSPLSTSIPTAELLKWMSFQHCPWPVCLCIIHYLWQTNIWHSVWSRDKDHSVRKGIRVTAHLHDAFFTRGIWGFGGAQGEVPLVRTVHQHKAMSQSE